MRTFGFVLRSLSGAAALTTALGCHGEAPQRAAPATTALTVPDLGRAKVAAVPPTATPSVTPILPTPVAVIDEAVEPTPSQLVRDARDALDAGELDRALKLARLAVLEAPGRSAAWNTLGRVQLRRGERAAALDSFDQAVETDPSSAWAQNNLGLALLYDGRYDEAAGALEEATELSPEVGLMWNNLGMAYEHLDRIEEARMAYRRAMGLDHRPAAKNFVRIEGIRGLKHTAQADLGHDDLDEDLGDAGL